jgi:hypothetical protein
MNVAIASSILACPKRFNELDFSIADVGMEFSELDLYAGRAVLEFIVMGEIRFIFLYSFYSSFTSF